MGYTAVSSPARKQRNRALAWSGVIVLLLLVLLGSFLVLPFFELQLQVGGIELFTAVAAPGQRTPNNGLSFSRQAGCALHLNDDTGVEVCTLWTGRLGWAIQRHSRSQSAR